MAGLAKWGWTARTLDPTVGCVRTSRYCVVGAGAAGLGATQVLTAQGFELDCFERSDRVGGHWHTDYESLHLSTSRDVSAVLAVGRLV